MHTQQQYAYNDSAYDEDERLFSGQVVQLTVELVPMIDQRAGDDFVVRGFVEKNRSIEVVFAGRRAQQSLPLISRLRANLARRHRAAGLNGPVPEAQTLRQPVRIEGSWHSRFRRDSQGWQTRQHQLYAARWLVSGPDGRPVTYGYSPLV